MKDAEKGSNARFEIDLVAQTVKSSEGLVIVFEVDDFKKHCLLNGLDDISLSLEKLAFIENYEKRVAESHTWI